MHLFKSVVVFEGASSDRRVDRFVSISGELYSKPVVNRRQQYFFVANKLEVSVFDEEAVEILDDVRCFDVNR